MTIRIGSRSSAWWWAAGPRRGAGGGGMPHAAWARPVEVDAGPRVVESCWLKLCVESAIVLLRCCYYEYRM